MATGPVSVALLKLVDEAIKIGKGERAKFDIQELADWTAQIRDCGFTRTDVMMLRVAQGLSEIQDWDGLADSLANRIEALLPPKDKA